MIIERTSIRLATLISTSIPQLLADWRANVRQLLVARKLSTPVLNDHMTDLLDILVVQLRRQSQESLIEEDGTFATDENPVVHGLDRLELGFDLEEVVYEYNALRSSVVKLASAHDLNITGQTIHSVNRVIDGAIGIAVKTFAGQQALEIRARRDEYLAFVVHDLRSPLASVSLATNLLDRQICPEPDSEEQELLEIMRSGLRKLERMIHRVLEEDSAIRAESEQRVNSRWVDLERLLLNLIAELDALAKRSNVELRLETGGSLQGFVDPDRAELVFQNLISNAIRYAPGGLVVVHLEKTSQGVECSVRDNGAGIDPTRLAKIFESGESDCPAGFGLGLSIVQRLVQAHGGAVRVESTVGQGTRFFFDFPDPTA